MPMICSGFIIFSIIAAIILNKQWPKIWAKLFRGGDDTYNPKI